MPEEPDAETVLDVLCDATAREILEVLSEPMTASEIEAACGLPRSSVYRKLNQLSAASLLDTDLQLRPDGHHTTRYRVDFESVVVGFTERRAIDADVVRPSAPGARLESLWTEVRQEA